MELITVVVQRLATFAPHRKGGFLELFISKRLIQGLAAAMMGMFLPIFLYEVSGNQFLFPASFYAITALGYAILLVPGMKVTNAIGFSRALAFGTIFSITQFVLLYFTNETNYSTLIIPIMVAVILFRIFHWVPYHVDFTAFTQGGERGRDVSLIFATIAFMGMLGPVLAGYIVANSGYSVLFAVCVVLLIAAAVSYLFVPAVEEEFTWSFRETLHNLFSPRFRNVLLGEMANGAEIMVTTVAWPIFLYTVLDGNVLEVGMLSTLIVGVTIVIQLLVGKYLDKKSDNKILALKRGSVFYSIGWIVKMFVLSATQIFFIGLYHNITKIFLKTPYSAILYDMSGEQGHYVDEFTVLREMASQVGRALALGAMVLLALNISIEWTFIIGAIASLMVNAIYYAARSQ
jgi:YQGE family putative transporter